MTTSHEAHAVNSGAYWEARHASGGWKERGGRNQSRQFAEAQVRLIDLPEDFVGTILDFGCGMGDALPAYRRRWPRASLMGLDISQAAVDQARLDYGAIGTFL